MTSPIVFRVERTVREEVYLPSEVDVRRLVRLRHPKQKATSRVEGVEVYKYLNGTGLQIACLGPLDLLAILDTLYFILDSRESKITPENLFWRCFGNQKTVNAWRGIKQDDPHIPYLCLFNDKIVLSRRSRKDLFGRGDSAFAFPVPGITQPTTREVV